MPDPVAGQPNQTQVQSETGFSKEYVSSLREEAASYRTKLREAETRISQLETKYTTDSVSKLLTEKGIKADPSWIKLEQGQTPEQAVEKFVELYPHLKIESENETKPTPTPKAQTTKKENTMANNRKTNPDIKAIKDDPVARAKIRDHYREMLRSKNQQVI